ncbi:MAG: helix-turn-helix domain-containing protein [Actinomycetota bacterium]
MSKASLKTAYDRLSWDEQVAINICIKLRQLGLNHIDLAQRLGLPRSSISRRLRGEYKFAIGELIIIAEYFKCDISEFLP